MYIDTYTYIYICMNIRIYIYMYRCMNICMNVCMCIYIYIHIHVLEYIYIYIHHVCSSSSTTSNFLTISVCTWLKSKRPHLLQQDFHHSWQGVNFEKLAQAKKSSSDAPSEIEFDHQKMRNLMEIWWGFGGDFDMDFMGFRRF